MTTGTRETARTAKTAVPPIVLPHGGYRSLVAFQKSEVVYLMTVVFCRRFLPKFGDRTVDHMTQAAQDWDKSVYSRLEAAQSAEELTARAAEIRRKVDSAVWAIKKRKGW